MLRKSLDRRRAQRGAYVRGPDAIEPKSAVPFALEACHRESSRADRVRVRACIHCPYCDNVHSLGGLSLSLGPNARLRKEVFLQTPCDQPIRLNLRAASAMIFAYRARHLEHNTDNTGSVFI